MSHQNYPMKILIFCVLLILTIQQPTNCNNKSTGNGLLEVETLDKCKDQKVCAVSCSKIVRGCKYKTAFFNLDELASKMTTGVTDPDTKEPSSWERIAYKEVCVERRFTKSGDFFHQLLKAMKKFEKIENAKNVVDCTRNFIFFFRDISRKCRELPNWQNVLKQEVAKFDIKKCQLNQDQEKGFAKIQTPIQNTYMTIANVDDDISVSKFCGCLDFETFFGAKTAHIMGVKQRFHLDKFKVDYIKLHKRMRKVCETKCGKKNGIVGWVKNVARIAYKGIKDFGFEFFKAGNHIRIISIIKTQIQKLSKKEKKQIRDVKRAAKREDRESRREAKRAEKGSKRVQKGSKRGSRKESKRPNKGSKRAEKREERKESKRPERKEESRRESKRPNKGSKRRSRESKRSERRESRREEPRRESKRESKREEPRRESRSERSESRRETRSETPSSSNEVDKLFKSFDSKLDEFEKIFQ